MSRRRRKHRKRFACGHQGYGQYCHSCDRQTAQKQTQLKHRQAQRQEWQSTFNHDLIPLQHLPKAIVQKARTILAALDHGTHYWQLSGKRFTMMHNIIKIPVTYRYRLLCHDDGEQIIPVAVISHEDYNPLARNPK